MRLALVALASVAVAVPGAAQRSAERQLGSNIHVEPKTASARTAADVQLELQRCYYRRNTGQIDAMLRLSDPATVDFAGADIDTQRFFDGSKVNSCGRIYENTVASRSIGFTHGTFRYMMVEEAYLTQFPDTPSALLVQDMPAPERHYVSDADALPVAQGLGAFADCIVEEDAAGADKIVRTIPGSAEERAAARALVAALGACVTEGQQLQLRPANIRAFAADGLWQRFVASAGEPVVGNLQ